MPSSVNQILKVANQYCEAFPVNPEKVKKQIIDEYNQFKPSSEYTIKMSDPWCAAFVGAVAGRCGAGDIIPISASCSRMIESFRNCSRWRSYDPTPQPGMIIFYDWDKNGTPDHVGIVDAVSAGNIRVIEGNMNGRVGTRIIPVNYALIEGYGVPAYTETGVSTPVIPANDYEALSMQDRSLVNQMPILRTGSCNVYVTILQSLLVLVGDYPLEIDGDFGEITRRTVMDFQKTCALDVDGVVGKYTWAALLV